MPTAYCKSAKPYLRPCYRSTAEPVSAPWRAHCSAVISAEVPNRTAPVCPPTPPRPVPVSRGVANGVRPVPCWPMHCGTAGRPDGSGLLHHHGVVISGATAPCGRPWAQLAASERRARASRQSLARARLSDSACHGTGHGQPASTGPRRCGAGHYLHGSAMTRCTGGAREVHCHAPSPGPALLCWDGRTMVRQRSSHGRRGQT